MRLVQLTLCSLCPSIHRIKFESIYETWIKGLRRLFDFLDGTSLLDEDEVDEVSGDRWASRSLVWHNQPLKCQKTTDSHDCYVSTVNISPKIYRLKTKTSVDSDIDLYESRIARVFGINIR